MSLALGQPSKRIPTAVVDLLLQLSADQAWHPMVQDCVANHGVVPLLIEEKLSSVAELKVRFTILVNVRCRGVRAGEAEEVDG